MVERMWVEFSADIRNNEITNDSMVERMWVEFSADI